MDLQDGYYGSMSLAYADPSTAKRAESGVASFTYNETVRMLAQPGYTGLDDFDWLQTYMQQDPEGLARRKEANRASSGSLHPAFNSIPSLHGSFGEINGKTVRYHQIAHGILAGVLPEDWDDSVHVKDDTVLEWGDSYPVDFGVGVGSEFAADLSNWELDTSANPVDPRDIFDRDFRATCSAGLQCARTQTFNTYNWVRDLAPGFKNGVI